MWCSHQETYGGAASEPSHQWAAAPPPFGHLVMWDKCLDFLTFSRFSFTCSQKQPNIGGHQEWEAIFTIPSIMDEETKFQGDESNFLQSYTPGKEQRVRREWIQVFYLFPLNFSWVHYFIQKIFIGSIRHSHRPCDIFWLQGLDWAPKGQSRWVHAQRRSLLCVNA